MDKVKIKFSKKSDVEVNYFGEVVKVNPVISLAEQKMLRDVYVESFFKDGVEESWDEQFAQFMLRREVLNIKTNLDLEDLTIEDLDNLIWGEFYDKVASSIVNYQDVTSGVLKSISNIIRRIEMKSNIGYLVKDLFDKVLPVIENFKNFKPEDIDKLKETASEMIEKMKTSPISEIISDEKRKTKE